MSKLISFTGHRGSGKTTQTKKAADYIASKGIDVHLVSMYKNPIPQKEIMYETKKYLSENHKDDKISTNEYKRIMEAIGLKLSFEMLAAPYLDKDCVIVFDRYIETYDVGCDDAPIAREILYSFPPVDLKFLLDVDAEIAKQRVIERDGEFTARKESEEVKRALYNKELKNQGYVVVDVTEHNDQTASLIHEHIDNLLYNRKNVMLLGSYMDSFIARARTLYNITLFDQRDDEKILEKIGDSDVVVIRSPFVLTDQMINKAKKLKLILRAGTSIDLISPLYKDKGIELILLKNNSFPVAEHALGLMFCALRPIIQANSSVKQGEWLKNFLKGREVYGKTVGIVGFGAIGSLISHFTSSLGAEKILVYDRSMHKPEKTYAARISSANKAKLEEIALEADIIFFAVPFTDETNKMINEEFLSKLKKDVILINVARGKIVDDEKIYDFLKTNPKAVYATDVYSQEPPVECKFVSLPNVICTPHIAAQTYETRERIEKQIEEHLCSFFSNN